MFYIFKQMMHIFIYSCKMNAYNFTGSWWEPEVMVAAYFGLIRCLSGVKCLRALSERFCVSFQLDNCPPSDFLYVTMCDQKGGTKVVKGSLKEQWEIHKGGLWEQNKQQGVKRKHGERCRKSEGECTTGEKAQGSSEYKLFLTALVLGLLNTCSSPALL